MNGFDIISMPDKWEYPWFAAWDLSFHCVTLAHLDPAFAKYQLIMMCREWYQHPNGALPAYEWDFNFTWWVNRQDASDKNVFEGGSLAWTTSARSTVRTCRPATPWSSPTRRAGWAPTR